VNRNKRINLSTKHANVAHSDSNKQANDDIELGDLKTCKTQTNEQDMNDEKQFDTSNDLNDNSNNNNNNNNNSFNQKELLDVVLMKKKSKFNRKSSIASDSSVVISMLNKSASNNNNNSNTKP
jgi:hypothetical protein